MPEHDEGRAIELLMREAIPSLTRLVETGMVPERIIVGAPWLPPTTGRFHVVGGGFSVEFLLDPELPRGTLCIRSHHRA